MSKGSRQRKPLVPQSVVDSNWDAIFRKPDPRVVQDAQAEDEAFKIIEERQSQVKDTDQGG